VPPPPKHGNSCRVAGGQAGCHGICESGMGESPHGVARGRSPMCTAKWTELVSADVQLAGAANATDVLLRAGCACVANGTGLLLQSGIATCANAMELLLRVDSLCVANGTELLL
jgi:hypothetical protein